MNKPDFGQVIGYDFRNPKLLAVALTHSSFGHESPGSGKGDETPGGPENNERLEFLGDSVLSTIISEHLYSRISQGEEGRLSKLRALIVCERSLAEAGRTLGIGPYLALGRGEEQNGGREQGSILADAMEAVIGALYLDGGLLAARTFVLSSLEPIIEKALSGGLMLDFKTEIQERLQARSVAEIAYRIDKEEGPDHSKVFYASLWADGVKLGLGQGKTKKEAEQNAARAALEDLDRIIK